MGQVLNKDSEGLRVSPFLTEVIPAKRFEKTQVRGPSYKPITEEGPLLKRPPFPLITRPVLVIHLPKPQQMQRSS